jgi:hypothetical protein
MKKFIIRNGIYDAFFLSKWSESANPTNAIAKRGCASQEVLAAQLAADPTLVLRMMIEAFTQKWG